MDLDDINDEMGLKLPTDESDTLGGLVYNSLGRIPQAADVIDGGLFDVPDVRLTVLAVDGRRIKTVKLERFSGHGDEPETERNSSDEKASFWRSSQNSIPNS
jgi:putative hemolysin